MAIPSALLLCYSLLMPNVKMYSKKVCPFCVRAKNLFKQKGIEVEEILLDGKFDELAELVAKTGMRTVPQIFIGDHFVGGYTELAELERDGKLDPLLQG